MKSRIRKLTLYFLVTLLILIEGCGKKDVEVEKEIPMGRYIEQDVTGDIKVDEALGFFKTKKGKLQMYLMKEGFLQIYEEDQEGSWTRVQNDWVRSVFGAACTTSDQVGNIYIIYNEFNKDSMNFETFLSKVEGKRLKKIDIAWQGESRYRAPHSFAILDNGDMLIAENHKPIERYSLSNGSFIRNYEGIPSRFVVSDNKLYQINLEESVIEVYDADTDKLERSIPCENLDANAILVAGEEGDLYLIGRCGIKHLVKDGSMWELLVDGNLTCLSMPSYTCQYAGVTDKEIFVIFKKNEGDIVIKKYT